MYLICGEALFDVFADTSGEPACPALSARAGGSPMNVAIGLARLGQRVEFLSQLSRDALGRNLWNLLKGEGVGTRFVQDSEEKTTLSFVSTGPDGLPDYAFYAPSSETGLDFDAIPDLGGGIRALHFGSYSLVVGKTAAALHELARRECHRFISIDVNVRPTVEPDIEIWKRRVDALLPFANLIKASDEDLRLLYGTTELSQIAANWLDHGVDMVIVTRGAGPTMAWRRGLVVSVDPPQVQVVDTVGAGDSFQAAFLAQLADRLNSPDVLLTLSRLQLETMLHFANDAAAVTCSRNGADLPSQGEVLGRGS